MLIKLRRKCQSTVEYGIMIGIIVGAVVAMQTYIKRSLQAKQKDAADLLTSVTGTVEVDGKEIGTLAATNQYEPYYLSRHQQQEVSKDSLSKDVSAGGESVITKDQETTSKSAVTYRYDKEEADK